MSAPIIIVPRKQATVVVGKGQTAGSPIFVPSTGGGSGGVGGLISTIKVNGEKKNLTTEPVVRPIEGGYNIEFNNQDVSIKT